MKQKITIIILILCTFIACQSDKIEDPPGSANLTPVYSLGDTLKNTNETIFEETEIIFDSISQIGFRLTSSRNFIPNQSASYFIRINFDYSDKVKLLDSLAYGGQVFSGPILSTFQHGDTIKFNIADEETFDWFPQIETQIENTGWMKYHIFTSSQGSVMNNFKSGENYIVFKFGEVSNERMGWLNIVYQDTLCYVKEGYYNMNIGENIVVGEK
jgi:hypothetical protein